MKSLLAFGVVALLIAIVVGWLWMIEPEVETAEPDVHSDDRTDQIVSSFQEAAAALQEPKELEEYEGYSREQLERALREFRLSSWPVTWERAQGFEDWEREAVWDLGVDRYGWYPGNPPTNRTREMMLDRMQQDVRFEHYEDSLSGELRDFGYTGEDR